MSKLWSHKSSHPGADNLITHNMYYNNICCVSSCQKQIQQNSLDSTISTVLHGNPSRSHPLAILPVHEHVNATRILDSYNSKRWYMILTTMVRRLHSTTPLNLKTRSLCFTITHISHFNTTQIP